MKSKKNNNSKSKSKPKSNKLVIKLTNYLNKKKIKIFVVKKIIIEKKLY